MGMRLLRCRLDAPDYSIDCVEWPARVFTNAGVAWLWQAVNEERWRLDGGLLVRATSTVWPGVRVFGLRVVQKAACCTSSIFSLQS